MADKSKETQEQTAQFGMRMKARIKKELDGAAQKITRQKGIKVTASALAGIFIEEGLKRMREGSLQI
jgi:Rod binding domain-containing protein